MTVTEQDRARLMEFLKAYAKWAYEDGAPAVNKHRFCNKVGLCGNAFAYGIYASYDLLSAIFKEQGIDSLTPFGGAYRPNMSEVPGRKRWVHSMLERDYL